jgi:hypothetical protein
MPTKIYRSGSYIVLDDGVLLKEIPTKNCTYDVNVNDYIIINTFKGYETTTIAYSDVRDEDGVAYVSEVFFVDWLRKNTGSEVSLDVTLQDSTAPLFIVKASNLIAETTIGVITAKDDLTITVASSAGFVVGQYLTIYNPTANRVSFFTVLGIASLVITVDTPLDFEYAVGSFVSVGNTNMNVDGSVTPQIFGIRNPSNVDIPLAIDVTRIIFNCLCSSSLDLSEFGNIVGGITRGFVVRYIDGTYRNIFNVKTNAEMKNKMFNFEIEAAHGSAQDGFTAIITFAGQDKLGAVIRLREAEDLQFIVQDNLTSLVSFTAIAQGSQVVD